MNLFGQHVYLPVLLLACAEFLFAGTVFVLAAYALLPTLLFDTLVHGRLITWALLFSSAVILGMTAMGLYQIRQRLRIEGVLVRLLIGLCIAAVCLSVIDFMFPLGVGRLLWGVSFLLTLTLLCATRIAFWKFVSEEAFRRCVLVYGAGKRASNLLLLRRRSDQRGFRIAAFVAAPGDRITIDDSRVIRLTGSLRDYALANQVSEVVVAMDDRRGNFPVKDLLDCKFSGIAVVDLVAFLERETGKIKIDLVNPSWLIYSTGFSNNTAQAIVTRIFDLLAASLLLVVLLPVIVAAVIAILLEDGRPVLYRQKRVGYGGKVFTLYKLRSMVKNAEADGTAVWARKQDARITRVGAITRKLRLDELPQLLNVLRGDMSLVGPRPERPEFVEQLAQKLPYYHERHSVKPGITGWAQLSYPYGASDHDAMEKLQYDLYYVKHRSLVFDLIVLLQTAEVVVWGKGAR